LIDVCFYYSGLDFLGVLGVLGGLGGSNVLCRCLAVWLSSLCLLWLM
jgi:hypothetical protein